MVTSSTCFHPIVDSYYFVGERLQVDFDLGIRMTGIVVLCRCCTMARGVASCFDFLNAFVMVANIDGSVTKT